MFYPGFIFSHHQVLSFCLTPYRNRPPRKVKYSPSYSSVLKCFSWKSSPGLHHLAFQSLQKVPDHARKDTVDNIVLARGSSMFPGFPERMCLELNALFHSTGCRIRVLAMHRSLAGGLNGCIAHILPACVDGKERVPGARCRIRAQDIPVGRRQPHAQSISAVGNSSCCSRSICQT
ncbi:hypothetical protein Q9233_002049 [Columba guinea]|nr:hypothetical protein Q9233_002049 [Columba guinea]